MTFEKLEFQDQAKSISASIINLQRSIQVHVSQSATQRETERKCIKQIHRLLGRLLEE